MMFFMDSWQEDKKRDISDIFYIGFNKLINPDEI